MIIIKITHSAVLCCVMGMGVPVQGDETAKFYSFGPTGGGAQIVTRATAVSEDGSTVVGTVFTLAGGTSIAFRWTEAGGMVYIPGLDQAKDVNADGSVIVGYTRLSAEALIAYRWTETEGLIPLADLPGGLESNIASAVSSDGTIIVGDGVSDSGTEAFRMIGNGDPEPLGDLPGGDFGSFATGISGDGSTIVGQSISSGSFTRTAYQWTEGSGMVELPLLPGHTQSFAADANFDGSVIVGSSGIVEAVMWTDETVQPLGTLPNAVAMDAQGVSDDGSVVVGIAVGEEAFIWSADEGMRALKQVLLDGGADIDDWHLSFAMDISGDGSTIVGQALSPAGDVMGFTARLPGVPCPADLTSDDQVNIDDIFAVLGLWGDCEDPCPPYCVGDLTEDCTVNIDDIFAILGQWGPCE